VDILALKNCFQTPVSKPGVAGFVLPGDSVDIIYTRNETSRRGGSGVLLSDVLLQNVKVLGIDQDLDNQSSSPSVVGA